MIQIITKHPVILKFLKKEDRTEIIDQPDTIHKTYFLFNISKTNNE